MGTLSISQKKIIPTRRDGQIGSSNIIVSGGGGGGGTSTGSPVEILGFGDGTEALPSIFFTSDPDTGIWRQGNNTIGVSVGGDEKFRFDSNGSFYATDDIVGFSTYISDARLKDEVEPIQNALGTILKLNGIKYTYKIDKQKHYGIIAQEAQKIIPEIIKEHELINDNTKYLTIRYSEIIPYLIEAIKTLNIEISKLKLEINYLRNYNT